MKLRLLPAIAALCALFTALFSSCKEDTIISASVTPSVDNIHTFGIGRDFGLDTISLATATVYDDSAVTSLNTVPAFSPIGWLSGTSNGDPYSGNTAGSLYMQVIPPFTGLSLTDDPDSGFIILPYSGFIWGDTMQPSTQTYRAYRISEPFSKDSLYYSFFKKNTESEVIGVGSFHINGTGPRLVDSVSVNGKKVTPHLRIELSQSFLRQLRSLLNGIADSSYAAFINAFRGFYIVPDSSAPRPWLPYFRLDPAGSSIYSQSGVVLYKHLASGSDTTYAFPLNPNYAAHFTRITRNYVSTEALNTFQPGSDKLLLQNAPGAAIDVKIPIAGLPKGVVINKCELVITELPEAVSPYFSRPPRILPVGIDESGARFTILDRFPTNTVEALNFIDGSAREEKVGATTYTRYHINFPRELQRSIVQGKSSLHLRIGGTATFPAAYRLVAGSRIHPDQQYRMTLNIVYSKQ